MVSIGFQISFGFAVDNDVSLLFCGKLSGNMKYMYNKSIIVNMNANVNTFCFPISSDDILLLLRLCCCAPDLAI